MQINEEKKSQDFRRWTLNSEMKAMVQIQTIKNMDPNVLDFQVKTYWEIYTWSWHIPLKDKKQYRKEIAQLFIGIVWVSYDKNAKL